MAARASRGPGMAADSAGDPAVLCTTVEGRPAWILRTRKSAMVLSLNAEGMLVVDHWGGDGRSDLGDDYVAHSGLASPGHLQQFDGLPLAYPTHGDPHFKEPCLAAVYHDGTRHVRLHFRADRVGRTDEGFPFLELAFEDPAYLLAVTLVFVVHLEHDLVARRVHLENRGDEPVTIERALSAGFGLPPARYEAFTLHGRWSREFQLTRRALLPGKLVIESR